jgi:ATP-dependent DNA helicase RecQ
MQEEIISSVLDGKDTLALLPTGGGKSLCYQVPALAQEGICLVISPLIALMRDQVEGLRERGIKALSLFSGMSYREIDSTLDNAIYGDYKFLYVSPERLETEIFIERAKKFKVSLIAVDEAHCISEWGYDFRPAYLRIAAVRDMFPQVPILALTASATPAVQKDIVEKLAFKRTHKLFQKSFDRPNLVYAVLPDEDKAGRLVKLFDKVIGSALVYCGTRKSTKEVAGILTRAGLSADYYHAGLRTDLRTQKQQNWQTGRTRIMACTNAFGMGIDKADVRLVVHYHMPASLEAYYQEAGRAGRDEKKAFAIALANDHDRLELEQRAELSLPQLDEIKRVYNALGSYFQLPLGSGEGQSFDFDLSEFCSRFDFKAAKVHAILNILEHKDYLALSEDVFLPTRMRILVDHHTLYSYEIANKAYEPLIKTLLRSYGGCFEEFVKISEAVIAQRTGEKTSEIVKKLHEMARQELIAYEPQKSSPQITYIAERLSDENLLIDHTYLKQRRTSIEDKLRSVMDYAYTEGKCRSRILLGYFGEEPETDCGHCDYCLKKKEKRDTAAYAVSLQKAVKEILQAEPLTLEEIIARVKSNDERSVREAVRWMIDSRILFWTNEKQVALAKP